MPDKNDLIGDEEFSFSLGLVLRPASLPPLRCLSSKQISYLAIRIAGHYVANPSQEVKVTRANAQLKADFYDVIISGSTTAVVVAKSQSRKFWRRRLHREADVDRLNYEARNRVVGGSSSGAEIYASDATVIKARQKEAEIEKYLAGQVMVNTFTGEKISLSELARQALVNRFNELYWISKNLESIADERGMGWLFVTYTAPPEYHPNPLNGKCSYDAALGVKASHSYILSAWSRVRSLLSKRDIRSGIDTYFGMRTAETHKDGSVHWHILVFVAPHLAQDFINASATQFAQYGQMKVEVGDPAIGSASSYIFKYLAKGFDPSVSGDSASSNGDEQVDEFRENSDMASIRNGERVRAALRAMRIRQYQTFGVKNVLSLVRAINKLKGEEIQSLTGEVALVVSTEIWRNVKGLKYLLENDELITKVDGVAPLMIVKQEDTNIYGERILKYAGLKIGVHIIRTQGRYKIEKA